MNYLFQMKNRQMLRQQAGLVSKTNDLLETGRTSTLFHKVGNAYLLYIFKAAEGHCMLTSARHPECVCFRAQGNHQPVIVNSSSICKLDLAACAKQQPLYCIWQACIKSTPHIYWTVLIWCSCHVLGGFRCQGRARKAGW